MNDTNLSRDHIVGLSNVISVVYTFRRMRHGELTRLGDVARKAHAWRVPAARLRARSLTPPSWRAPSSRDTPRSTATSLPADQVQPSSSKSFVKSRFSPRYLPRVGTVGRGRSRGRGTAVQTWTSPAYFLLLTETPGVITSALFKSRESSLPYPLTALYECQFTKSSLC